MTPDPAAELAEALRRLLTSLRGRPVDRRKAIDHATRTLNEWDLSQ